VTENTSFRGAVYMTEPTLQFGRLLMEETIEFVERRTTRTGAQRAKGWKDVLESLPGPLAEVQSPHQW
jgi:integrator complex subunit 9